MRNRSFSLEGRNPHAFPGQLISISSPGSGIITFKSLTSPINFKKSSRLLRRSFRSICTRASARALAFPAKSMQLFAVAVSLDIRVQAKGLVNYEIGAAGKSSDSSVPGPSPL